MAVPTLFHFFRVVADPEVRTTQSGANVATIRLVADDAKFNKQTNAWDDPKNTLWLRGTAWNEVAAEVIRAQKGDQIQVAGTLKTNSWEKDGQKHQQVELNIQFAKVWPKQGGNNGGGNFQGNNVAQQAQYQQQYNQQNVNQAAQQFGNQGMTQQDPWGSAPNGQQGFGGGFQDPPF